MIDVKRGELYRVRHPSGDPKRSRVFVVVSRPVLVESRLSTVICAPVYTHHEGLESQVAVGVKEGLRHESSIHCDGLVSILKSRLTDWVGVLGATKLLELKAALRVALHVE